MNKEEQLEETLSNAIRQGDLTKVNECLSMKPTIHGWQNEEKFRTPWHWAHSYGTYSIVKALLDAGADPNHKLECLNGETVLFGAVTQGNIPVVRVLVSYKADINLCDDDGLTPLQCAIARSSKRIDMMKTLLESGADVTAGQDIVEWMKNSCPEYEDLFYDVFDDFLEDIEEIDSDLYHKNLKRLRKLAAKHPQCLSEELMERIKSPSTTSVDKLGEHDSKPDGKGVIDSSNQLQGSTRSQSPEAYEGNQQLSEWVN